MAFNISYVYHALDKFTPVANKIKRSVDQTRRKFQGLQRQMDKTNRSTGVFGNTLGNMKTRVLALGAALTAGVGIKALVGFGAAMSKVKAVSGATSEEFNKMRIVAKELGATTVFSASEAAGGMEFLARAGFKASDIIKSMPAVLDLAASSALDLATAADITSNIMTGFGIEASETNRIADLMATINASANTNVQQLGDAMKFVGPIANKMGQSIEVTAAAMGALADAGLQGGMGGTGLRKVLSTLASPTKKVSKGLAALGVDLRKINPETNDLVVILKELTKANLSGGDALQIFGERGGPAFSVLIDNIPKIQKLTEKLNNSAGAAKRMAAIMRDNLQGAGKEAISAFEGLIITLGDAGLTAALRALAVSITAITRGIQFLLETFPRLTQFIGVATASLVAFKVATIAAGLGVKAFAAVTVLSSGAMVIFNAVLLANPIGALIGLAALAAAGFWAFRESIGETINSLLGFFNMELPNWIRNIFGMDSIAIKVSKGGDDPIHFPVRGGKGGDESVYFPLRGSEKDGVAVNASRASSVLNGTINVNAPPGVVNSVSSTLTGSGGNLGVSMAGAG